MQIKSATKKVTYPDGAADNVQLLPRTLLYIPQSRWSMLPDLPLKIIIYSSEALLRGLHMLG